MRRAILPLLVLCLGTAGVASADPVTLTSGTIVVGGELSSSFGEGSFDFSGSGFQAGGGGSGSAPHLSGFSVGTLDLSGTVGVNDSNPGNGSITIGTETLRGFTSATFQVIATPVVVTDSGERTIGGAQTPFTATGLVQLFATPGGGTPIFSQEVTGSGMMSIGGINVGNGQYLTGSVGLTFAPANTSATPEPASMLLLGTGLVAAWRARRLRRMQ